MNLKSFLQFLNTCHQAHKTIPKTSKQTKRFHIQTMDWPCNHFQKSDHNTLINSWARRDSRLAIWMRFFLVFSVEFERFVRGLLGLLLLILSEKCFCFAVAGHFLFILFIIFLTFLIVNLANFVFNFDFKNLTFLLKYLFLMCSVLFFAGYLFFLLQP